MQAVQYKCFEHICQLFDGKKDTLF